VDVLLPFALILVAFYFLILRPQRARARQAEQLQSRLAPGVEVMTTSGLFGTVNEIRDDSVVLQLSPGATVRVAKAAVGRIVTEDGTPAQDQADDTVVDLEADGSKDRKALGE
jgi:preprotein translocase subunit YajC